MAKSAFVDTCKLYPVTPLTDDHSNVTLLGEIMELASGAMKEGTFKALVENLPVDDHGDVPPPLTALTCQK